MPEKLPAPTYWPAVLALGVVFLLFVIVTSVTFSAAGLILMVWSLGEMDWRTAA